VTLELDGTDPVHRVYLEADEVIREILEAHESEGRTPSCKPGCAACCHQLVVATVAEANAAIAWTRSWPAEQRRALDERLATWLSRTEPMRRAFQEAAGGDLEAEVEHIAETYWRERPACPFLVDAMCSIHPVRPLACRHHFSLSPPERCQADEPDGIDQMAELDDALFEASDTLPEEATEIGIFPELVAVLRD